MALPLQESVPLAPLTTLGLGGSAEFLVSVTDELTLVHALEYARTELLPVSVLGGGSNVLVPDTGVAGLVIHNQIRGIEFETEGEVVVVRVGAGEPFDALVAATVTENLSGLENLSHIPGTVGATPVQNVGAYGVEVADLIRSVRVYDRHQDRFELLTREECHFGYRNSRFKEERGRYIVTEVTFALSRLAVPNVTYKDLAVAFEGSQTVSPQAVRDAVIAIRSGKFPDWHVVGTAGSFFKNPIVSDAVASELSSRYPLLPTFRVGEGFVKLPLGWILEHVLKVKGLRVGNVGSYEKQALVLVCYDGATAAELDAFALKLTQDVFSETGISIEREVCTLGV